MCLPTSIFSRGNSADAFGVDLFSQKWISARKTRRPERPASPMKVILAFGEGANLGDAQRPVRAAISSAAS